MSRMGGGAASGCASGLRGFARAARRERAANAAQSTILAIGADIAWGKAPLGVAAVTMRGVRQPSPRRDYLRDRADSRFFAVFFANQE